MPSSYVARFLLKLIAGVSIYMLFVAVMLPVPDRQKIYTAKMSFFDANKEHIEAISVGFSLIKAVHFESLDIKGMHFYDTGGDNHSALSKLKALLPILPNLKYVFVPITETSLTYELDRNSRVERILEGIYYNQPTSAQQVIDYPRQFIKFGLIEPAFRINQLRDTVEKRLTASNAIAVKQPGIEPVQHHNEKIEQGVIEGYSRIANGIERLKQSATQRSSNMLDRYRLLKDPSKVVSNNIAVLEEITRFGLDFGVKTIFVRPPTTPYLRDKVKAITHLDRLKNSAPIRKNATVFDGHTLFDESLRRDENLYFFDSNHLNLRGAKIFSHELRKAL